MALRRAVIRTPRLLRLLTARRRCSCLPAQLLLACLPACLWCHYIVSGRRAVFICVGGGRLRARARLLACLFRLLRCILPVPRLA
ncbi:hypothetical protein C8R45DRAFT_1035175 [Mycena sanguinolenta]|nr:hypothetical protein C8R45DRAFT_1035175 [Mycena sanguinolenta]